LQNRIAMPPDIAVALIVGQDQNDVRAAIALREGAQRQGCEQATAQEP
jgi:hypothetical protein